MLSLVRIAFFGNNAVCRVVLSVLFMSVLNKVEPSIWVDITMSVHGFETLDDVSSFSSVLETFQTKQPETFLITVEKEWEPRSEIMRVWTFS